MVLHILLLFYIILKFDHMMHGFWDMVCHRQTDRRTDGWTNRQTGFLKTHKMFSKNGLSLREGYIAMLIN